MVLDSWMYGDPEKVAIRKEEEALAKEKACGRCCNKVSMEWQGELYHGCQFKRRHYGKRCELYREKR
jgi:hypothetical protein